MAEKKIQRTGYTSEIDQFLREFDKKRTQIPDSVTKEIEKNKRIAEKRDGIVEEKDSPIWKEF